MLLIGPIGSIFGSFISSFILALQESTPILAWAVFTGLTPLLLVTGTHWIFIAIVLESLGTKGVDIGYLVSFFICSMSLAATCFATYLCEKSNPKRASILSCGLVVLLSGVSEPSLYGVCVPKKYPLAATAIGSCIGGIYQGIFTPYCMVYSFPALPTILMFYQADHPLNLLHALLAAAIGAFATFFLTLLLYKLKVK